MSLQLFKRVKAAITAFKEPRIPIVPKFVACNVVEFSVERQCLCVTSEEFSAGDTIQVANKLYTVRNVMLDLERVTL